MGSIKLKKGKCIDCPDDAPEKFLMAKRCIGEPYYHYTNFKNKSTLEKNKNKSLRRVNAGLTLGQWFNQQINIMPKDCENCGCYLNPYLGWGAKAYIAHIVPKRHFESVMCHPLNRLFLCIDCHTNFDNGLSREAILMNMWPIAVQRFKVFAGMISDKEIKHLRPCFEDIYNNIETANK